MNHRVFNEAEPTDRIHRDIHKRARDCTKRQYKSEWEVAMASPDCNYTITGVSMYASPKLCHIRRSCRLVDHQPTEVSCHQHCRRNTHRHTSLRCAVQTTHKSANTGHDKPHSVHDTLPYVCSSERDRNFHTHTTATTVILQGHLQLLPR